MKQRKNNGEFHSKSREPANSQEVDIFAIERSFSSSDTHYAEKRERGAGGLSGLLRGQGFLRWQKKDRGPLGTHPLSKA